MKSIRWEPTLIPNDLLGRAFDLQWSMRHAETEYLVVGTNILHVCMIVDWSIVISVFSLSERITYIECSTENSAALIELLQQTRISYNLEISSNSIKTFIWHHFAWQVLDCRNSRYFGYINIPPYIHRPVEILDITTKGEAKVVVYPEKDLIESRGTPQQVSIGFGNFVQVLDCIAFQSNILFCGLIFLKVPIEFLGIRTPVHTKICNFFFTHVPDLQMNPPFSYIQETLFIHEKCLQGDHPTSDSETDIIPSEEFVPLDDTDSDIQPEEEGDSGKEDNES
jgi:hypothetical protein